MAEPWSLGSVTAEVTRRRPEAVAAILPQPLPLPGISRKRRLTPADLERVVARGAAGLRKRGVEPADRVAVILRSDLHGLLAALAAARAGATPALIYGGLPPAETRPLVKAAEAGIVLGPEPGDFAAVLEEAGPEADPPRKDPAPDVAAILFTSGTTGTPKGVPLPTAGLEAALRFARLRPEISLGRKDRAIAALPLAHVMGFVLALAYLEARVPAVFLPRFAADEVLDAVESNEATVFAGVPGMYRLLDQADGVDEKLRSIRLFISAADVMPRELGRRFQHRGSSLTLGRRTLAPAFLVEGYGLVEASGPALFRVSGPIGLMRKYRPVPGWKARAVDGRGRPLPSGKAGVLELSGPGVTRGYLGEDAAEREWLRTQDLATVSTTGAVDIVGRSSDLMKVGGHRLHPGEIEDAMRAHPAVTDAGVAAIPHDVMGQVPAAAVVLARGAKKATPEELTAWAEDRLAKHKVPRTIKVVDEIPRTPTHKVRRGVLAELLSAGSEAS